MSAQAVGRAFAPSTVVDDERTGRGTGPGHAALRLGATLTGSCRHGQHVVRPPGFIAFGFIAIRLGKRTMSWITHLRFRCMTPADVAHDRIADRVRQSHHRAAHGDHDLLEALASGKHSLDSFVPISLDVPVLEVDTSDGYQPGMEDIVSFAQGSTP
ncbi:hypothetical protein B7P34_00695 [Streptosporangium nondiastaticum]|uniref:Uncharacterized protein n=2 Tax=Streptosporangium nondiastaticum TaxID=35764 RepID=A0A9X7PJY2_9ACTN|nr:hypothetical protein B7P34_00695 [Streptosporangium nondiastaticum]